jgi:hypothetical protein
MIGRALYDTVTTMEFHFTVVQLQSDLAFQDFIMNPTGIERPVASQAAHLRVLASPTRSSALFSGP